MKLTAQGVYWLLTIPHHEYTPYLHVDVAYIIGQLEQGEGTGYLHWQILVCFKRKLRLGGVRLLFGDKGHYELSKSDAADKYVQKEDTSIAGTRFCLGTKPHRRNNGTDWETIWDAARTGRVLDIEVCQLCKVGCLLPHVC